MVSRGKLSWWEKTSWGSKAQHLLSHSCASFQHSTSVHQPVINREQLLIHLGAPIVKASVCLNLFKWVLYTSNLCVGSDSTTVNGFLAPSTLDQGNKMHLLQAELSLSHWRRKSGLHLLIALLVLTVTTKLRKKHFNSGNYFVED